MVFLHQEEVVYKTPKRNASYKYNVLQVLPFFLPNIAKQEIEKHKQNKQQMDELYSFQ